MLHRYAFSNFQSFRDKTEVSFSLNGKVPSLGWERTSPAGQRLSSVMAAIGPNGSGKTSLIKPLVFLAWFIKESFRGAPESPIPFKPHFSAEGQSTELEFEADDADGQIWRYVVILTQERVIHEALYKKRDRFAYRFIRNWDESEQRYTVKQQDFGFAPSEAVKVRPNASLISTAAQYGVPLAQRLTQFHLQSNIVSRGRVPFVAGKDLPLAARHFATNEAQNAQMVQLLNRWDLGLSDVRLRELAQATTGETSQPVWFPYGVHRDRDGQERELVFWDESSGTQSAFVLLSRLLPVLSTGGLAVIDELENDLHPHMLEPVLDLFANPSTNPHNAQLVFTCHALEVLNLLHKSQIMLVEKNEGCESQAWRMERVQGIRADDNFYAKYMAGAYGAVPEL